MLLVAVIALLDLARHITGRIEFGWPNMLLLYALAHQFGFCYRDGWLLNVRRRWLVLAAAGALIALTTQQRCRRCGRRRWSGCRVSRRT